MFKSLNVRTCLAVQQLRLCTPNAQGMWSVPGWGLRVRVPLIRPKIILGKILNVQTMGGGSFSTPGSFSGLRVVVEKDSEVVSGL